MTSALSNLLNRISPYFFIGVFASLLAAFLLRNVSNWDYPLSGEYLTSPFYGDILRHSLGVWDEHFGLGFSNLLGSTGMAQYAPAYSGAIWVVSNTLNAAFQWLGAAYYFSQVFNIFLLGVGIYCALRHFNRDSWNIAKTVWLASSIVLIIHATDFYIFRVASAGRFPAAQGILLIAFIQYRQLLSLGFSRISLNNLIPTSLSFATLLLVFNSYFLALILLICMQGVIEFVWANEGRKKVVISYFKIVAMAIGLIVILFGYLWLPQLFSHESTLVSGVVGRHDTPMQYQVVDLLRFFNVPGTDRFFGVATWLQFGLVLLGIVLALSSPTIKRWVRIDLICVVIFLFLAKGSAPPFAEVNHWIHVNIPFMRLMGSGYPYFGIIYVLFIYYLIYGAGYAFDTAKKVLPHAGVYVAWLVLIFAVILAIFRNDDYLSGDFGGRVQSIEYPAEYYAFKKIAEKDMQLGRAYYLPDADARIGMDYEYSPTHSIRPMDCCYDLPFSSVFPISIHWSNFEKFSGYYGQTMNFLMRHLEGGHELAEIMSGADTRYLVFDLSLKKSATANSRMMAVRDMALTSKLFQFQPSLSNRYLEVYENRRWHPAHTVKSNISLSTDDPNVFLRAAKNETETLKESFVVSGAITLAKAVKLKEDNILKKVILYNSDETSLMLDLIHSTYELKPDANSLSSDGNLRWFTYNQVYQILDKVGYGGRFIGRNPIATMTEGVAANFFATLLPNVKNRLFIRAMVSPDSGRLWVYVNGDKRLLNLHSKGYVGLQWFDLGEVTNSTDKVKITVEALDVGYLKRIDVVSIIPLEAVTTSKEMMRNLLAEMRIERIEKPDYLQWKKVQQLKDGNAALPQEEMQITPKKLMATRHNFSLHEDFDRFDDVPGQETYNIIQQSSEKNKSSDGWFQDKNFVRNYGGYNSRFNASADLGNGTYSLKYELLACQAFSGLTVDLHTAFVTTERPINIYVSDDTSSWIRFTTLISDDRKILDLSEFAKGKKKIYLKISYDKPQVGPTSILLIGLRINGVAGDEKMICESHVAKGVHDRSLEKATLSENRYGYAHMDQVKISSNIESVLTNNKAIAVPGIALINKAYDPNWRMGDLHPLNIDYGFASFPIADSRTILDYHHDWQHKYIILLYASFGFYLFLWLALIWIGYRRMHRQCGSA